MLDTDLERTREYLRTRLPDYLRSRGINPDRPFNCLNPAHQDHQASMSYSQHNYTVHCYACNATYDIFTLAGLEYGLADPAAQFNKVYELFLGSAPKTQQPSSAAARSLYDTTGAATFGAARIEPTFEMKRPAYESSNDRSMAQSSAPHFSPLYQNAQPPLRPGSEYHEPRMSGLQSPFAKSADNDSSASFASQPPASLQPQPQPLQPTGAVFGIPGNIFRQGGGSSFISSSNERAYPEAQETQYNYAEQLRQMAEKVGRTEYFHQHGISDEVISRFRLGFDESFPAGTDAHTGEQIIWRAAVIPYSDFGYVVRNIDPKSKDKVRKRGTLGVFNDKALEQNGAIFITFDEIEALSLETLGFKAISIAPNAVNVLLERVEQSKGAERIFYICAAGEDLTDEINALSAGLYKLNVPSKKVSLSYPYASLNSALCLDSAGLKWRLSHLEELLTFTLTPVTPDEEEYSFIENPATLSKLDLSPYLYCLCGRPHVLRRVMYLIMQERLCRLVTVTTAMNWKFMCRNLADTSPEAASAVNYECCPNAKAVITDDLSSEKILDTVRYTLNALRLQSEGSFAMAVDLSTVNAQALSTLIPKFAALCTELQSGLLLLTPESSRELCESAALQTICVEQSEDGSELNFNSADLNCRRLNFSRYAGL
ncbi:MAG: hypothetical protein IAB19_06010 [Proteobacteria bacterium]|uniref:Zinc finger CHC2-type domain-containing protein n=1 Tax=Candidatus Avisuccinivibrio stercorigallinarum TaxID=2840704 RepID=A0A9D9GTF8_9GAMM|nr:hypothetical protein [Candidatus Avisuccinivibrio stercorigallinarum]